MHKTIATAESCTGGLLGALLTDRPGATDYYLGGVIAYQNRIKQTFLGVQAVTLKTYGAVSAETALEMARGVRKKLRADIGISITGIAGPSGGKKNKPVGLVYIALADAKQLRCERFIFSGNRLKIRTRAAKMALAWLRRDGVGTLQSRSK